MKILWVNPRPLYPMNTGGKKRTHSMLSEMAREHEITAIALQPDTEDLHPDEEGESESGEAESSEETVDRTTSVDTEANIGDEPLEDPESSPNE